MKNKGVISILITLVMLLCVIEVNASMAFAEETEDKAAAGVSPKVEISFAYQKQTGMGSNQFAIWIEDSSGRYIKTLYATRFTAKGGWQKRPQSLPGWVKASQPLNAPSSEIDAITGATPSAGNLSLPAKLTLSPGLPHQQVILLMCGTAKTPGGIWFLQENTNIL